jgi:hypothetical protein
MPAPQRQPILVTGSHRSGSTWSGRMIAAAPGVRYISEPFSVNSPSGICRARFRYWYTYITDENEAEFREDLAQTLSFRYNLPGELRELPANWKGARERKRHEQADEAAAPPSHGQKDRPVRVAPVFPMPRPLRRMVKDAANFAVGRQRADVALMKDPMALFSSEWLARTYGIRPVVLIRHPAAFASSLRRVRWDFAFSNFTAQPLLMRDLLDPYADEIHEAVRREHDILDQAALLWRVIHHVIAGFRDRHPDWLFLRHEDLAADPVAGFRRAYDHLGLQFTEDARRTIESHSSGANPAEAPGREVEVLRRDSRAAAKTWTTRLTPEEAERLREQVEPVASNFYSDADW